MNNNIVKLIAFASGAAIGSAITWFCMKSRYDKIHQEEIAELMKKYEGTVESKPEEVEDVPVIDILPEGTGVGIGKVAYPEFEQGTLEEYASIASAYTGERDDTKEPYVIPPEEFGGREDFTQLSFTLYSDGILTDENDRIVEDIENTVGSDSLNHFGEYEDDSVFVRNERLACDYEILLDLRTYEEVLGKKPYLQPFTEDEED